MLKGKKAVIFDMDGSLVDSMWIWLEVDKQYMGKYSLSAPENFYQDIEGRSFIETAQYFLDAFPTLAFTVEEVCKEWTEMAIEMYQTRVPLKEGAEEFLRRMDEQGILMGIATSNSRELAEVVLNALHVRQYFTAIITSDEVRRGKPEPDVYLKAAEELQVLPKECLVFEDVPNGIRAGKNAGMSVCAVHDSFSIPYETVKRELADFYIHDYKEIWNETYEICGE